MKPTRDDLRVPGTHNHYGDHYRKATDADLAAMGLVQAPECGECGGAGFDTSDDVTRIDPSCPKCGGSGYGRLVSLDVDVEALREHVALFDGVTFEGGWSNPQLDLARQVLASLDGEDT